MFGFLRCAQLILTVASASDTAQVSAANSNHPARSSIACSNIFRLSESPQVSPRLDVVKRDSLPLSHYSRASFDLRPWSGGSQQMAKFGLKEGDSILEVFEADTVVVHPPHTTAVFYSGLDDWRETARIHLKPGQTIETDPLRLPQ